MVEYFPIFIVYLSPLNVTPYHNELYSLSFTSPITQALGATKFAPSSSGVLFINVFLRKLGITFII